MLAISPEHEQIQYSGRIDFDDPKAPVLVYAASFIRIRFQGTAVKAVLENHHNYWTNYMGIIVDGVQGKFALENDGKKEYVLAENLSDGEHELLLFKRMDACHYVTFYGFKLEGAKEGCDPALLPCEKLPDRRIEVFGDSVSCGEVSEALDFVGKEDPVHDGEFSNSWYSYSWMTARKLGAELHDTSQGGIALLNDTGWFAAPDYLGVESCYDKIQYNPALGSVKKWDFSKYQPQVVIVAIGQNDNHPKDYMAEDYNCEKAKFWREKYEGFIRRLMEVYPDAHIVLTTTLLLHHKNWDLSIDTVCNRIDSERVHHFLYQRNGKGTPGHLRIPEAEEMAEELSDYINSLGNIW